MPKITLELMNVEPLQNGQNPYWAVLFIFQLLTSMFKRSEFTLAYTSHRLAYLSVAYSEHIFGSRS